MERALAVSSYRLLTIDYRLHLEAPADAERREEGQAAQRARLLEAVVVEGRLGVGGVVEVLDVEVDRQTPEPEQPRLLDADVELVEERRALGARRARDPQVEVLVAVEEPAEHGGLGATGDEAEARAQLPADAEPQAGDDRQDVRLVEDERDVVAPRLGLLLGLRQGIGEPAVEAARDVVLEHHLQ